MEPLKTSRYLIFLILFLSLIFNKSFSQTSFLKVFQGTLTNLKISEAKDGGYGLAGSNGSVIFIKTNAWGDILFQKSYYRYGIGYKPTDIKSTIDSGFVITALSDSQSVIIKINSLGDILWTRTFRLNNFQIHIDNIGETAGGNLVAFGLAMGSPKCGFIIKMNSLGDTLFTKFYYRTSGWSSTYYEVVGQITHDGGYILQGIESNPWIRTDSLGNLIWAHQCKSPGINPKIDESIFGDFYFVDLNYGALGYGAYIEKIDSSGNFKWNKAFITTTLDVFRIKCTSDGGFLLLTYSNSYVPNFSRPVIIKCDSSGNSQYSILPYDSTLLSYLTYGVTNDLQITRDSGFICSFQLPAFALKKYDKYSQSSCFDFPTSIPSVFPTYTNSLNIAQSYLPLQIYNDTIDISLPSITNNTICSNIGAAGNVWPGDCNYDLIVDNNDFLYLSIANGDSGQIRNSATLNWVPQPCANWNNYFVSGANHKHADTNGDGLVNLNDTMAILQNYNLNHPYRIASSAQQVAANNFYLVSNTDTAIAGSTISLGIFINDTTGVAIDSLYGLAYSLSFDPNVIDTSQINIDYSGSVLGTLHSDMESFEKDFYSNGIIDLALSKTDKLNKVNVGGLIATINLKILNNATGGSFTHILPKQLRALTYSESGVPFNLMGDSVFIINCNHLATANIDSLICKGDSITANAALAFPMLTSWSIDSDFVSNSTSFTTDTLGGGNHTIELIVSNTFCSQTITQTVFVDEPVQPTFNANGNLLTSSSATGNQWYHSGNIITGAIQNTYTILTSGWYMVSVTDSLGCIAFSDSNWVSPVGIFQLENTPVSVYPNPFTNEIEISIPAHSSYKIEINNAIGQTVYSGSVNDHVTLKTDKWSKGVYNVTLISSGYILKRRIVKQ